MAGRNGMNKDVNTDMTRTAWGREDIKRSTRKKKLVELRSHEHLTRTTLFILEPYSLTFIRYL